MSYYGFRPYVPVAKRRAIAARELEKLRKKGRKILPVVLEGRSIARTFWGKAWCENLERGIVTSSKKRLHLRALPTS